MADDLDPVETGGRRSRGQERREHPVTVKLSAAEKATLSGAAERAGKALATYLCEVGLDAAEHRAVPVPVMQREMLAELMRVAGLVRRIGVNQNQAVARLNATGEPGLDLGPSVAYCTRVLGHVGVLVRSVRPAAKLLILYTPDRGSKDSAAMAECEFTAEPGGLARPGQCSASRPGPAARINGGL
jgi:hypothetical protein